MRGKAGLLGANRQKGWDIASATYLQRLPLGSQPRDLFLSPNGDKLFTVVSSGINEHSLSTAWDISTATFVRYLNTQSQDQVCEGIFISGDGASLFVCGRENDAIYQYSLPNSFSLLSASYVRSFSVNMLQSLVQAVFFRQDGAVMYVASSGDDRVYEYTLATAWDISTASYARQKNIAGQATSVSGLWFRPNGHAMYVVDVSGDEITEYFLSTAWNVASAIYVRQRSLSAEGASPTGLFIDPDGFRMFVADQTGEEINQYKMN